MKKIVLLLGLLTNFSIVQAQLLKKLKDKVDKTVDKTVDDATKGKKDDQGSGGTNENTGGSNSSEPATMKTYSKYDFVPGEIIIVYEDFMQDAVGDFPDQRAVRNPPEAQGEVQPGGDDRLPVRPRPAGLQERDVPAGRADNPASASWLRPR